MSNDIKRTSNIKLPARAELEAILRQELRLDIAKGKENIHYATFGTVMALLNKVGCSTDIFTNDSLDIHGVVENGAKLLDQIVAKFFADESLQTKLQPELDAAYDYLCEEDQPEPSDVIVVFGAKTPLRPIKAAELYKHGLAKLIAVSGSRPIYGDNSAESEALAYKRVLVENGVPASNILLEQNAITIPDNVWRTIEMLRLKEVKFGSMILVNSPYSQRRGYVIFKKFLPDSVKLYRVNCETGEQYYRQNWHKQEDTFRVVLNEYIKMRASVVYNVA